MKCPCCSKPIDEHEVGRETDACVAEVVFEAIPTYGLLSPAGVPPSEFDYYDKKDVANRYSDTDYTRLEFYSSDIAAAWNVHEVQIGKLFSKRKRYLLALEEELCEREKHTVVWPDALVFLSPLAICRAALKAVARD